ncbi:tetratricopeptide repeat protein [Serratia sp. (in: enterobacteria)]|uniref:tetratricopeptide repeat protein n=1 Tax=Serratia sp. (in: enterobacteria) TaxID=616 RepID=UPI003989A44B
MVSPADNPVMRQVSELAERWHSTTDKREKGSLVVFRSRADTADLTHALLAFQEEQPGAHGINDLFATFSSPFLTGYDYCLSLYQELTSRAGASELPVPPWIPEQKATAHSPALFAVFADFIRHHRALFGRFVIVLNPESVSDDTAWMRWLQQAVSLLPDRLLLVLCDTHENPAWQPLIDSNKERSLLITCPANVFSLMKDTLHQQPGGGDPDSQRFRSLLLDIFILLERGTAQQVADRAHRALSLATEKQWHAQCTVVQNMIAGSHLKHGEPKQAICAYREAVNAAGRIPEKALRLTLLTQSRFSLAAAHYADRDYPEATVQYATGAGHAEEAGNSWLTIEGWRMAGHCQLMAKNIENASHYFAQAIKFARPLPANSRQMTSLPFLFQDLLLFHDRDRTQALTDCADEWLKKKSAIIQETERLSEQLSSPANADEIDTLDSLLNKKLTVAFNHIRANREQIIRQGNIPFQEVTLLARQLLHPYWAGVPDIAHPFDDAPGNWEALPDYLSPGEEEIVNNFITRHQNAGAV